MHNFRMFLVCAFMLQARVVAEVLHWEPLLEPGVGGAVTALAVAPGGSQRVFVGGDMLGVGRSVDGGKHWTQADANAGLKTGEFAEFTFDPVDSNCLWMATMDGPYQSRHGGRSWSQRREGLLSDRQWTKYSAPIQKILFDPADARHLLALGGNKRKFDVGKCFNYGAVWESQDAGEDWVLRSRIIPGLTNHEANITCVAYGAGAHSQTLFAAVTGKQLYNKK